MRISIMPLMVAGFLLLGGIFAPVRANDAARFPATDATMVLTTGENPDEGDTWREVLVVNTASMKYHKADMPCGSRMSPSNASPINGTSLKHARRYVEALGCTACERCFR